ncbi:MAG: ABC transporter substrate-binding protein [Caulobacterales bacterium]|nr:ABC transporter substrate-binding protein [Caulobacterales bacterium]
MLNAIWFVEPILNSLLRSDDAYSRSGVVINAQLTGSSDQQFTALRDCTSDFAVTSMDNVIMWRRRAGGEAMRIVAQFEESLTIDLVARKEFPEISSLAGARLLVDSADNGHVVALHKLLLDAGVDFHSCAVEEAGGVRQRLQALIEGKGDAATLGPPFTQMAQSNGLRLVANVNQRYSDFAGQGVIMRTDIARAKLEEIVRYLAACNHALNVASADREAVISRLVANSMPEMAARSMVSALGKSLTPDRRGVELLTEHRRDVGRPGSSDRYDDLVDLTLLDQALALQADDDDAD